MKYIVVVGVGRSGTSLLQSMLGSHPLVVSLPETSFLRRYCVSRTLSRRLLLEGKDGVSQTLAEDPRWRRTGLCADTLVAKSVRTNVPLEIALYRNMIEEYSGTNADKSTKAEWVIDKDPRLIEFLPLVKCAWDEAYVVHIVRDPRDVLLSKKIAQWSRDRHIAHHIFANRVQMRLGRQFGARLFRGRYAEIRYEDLITNPRDQLKLLCRAIGLNFDDSMLSFQQTASALVTEEEFGWKKETLGPLLSSNQLKWKDQLPKRELVLTELCNDGALISGGYYDATGCSALSLRERVWVAFWAAVIRFTAPCYMAYRKRMLKSICHRLK